MQAIIARIIGLHRISQASRPTHTLGNRIDLQSSVGDAVLQRASADPASQTEMPNRTSFSEVPAAQMPPFGDSKAIEVVKLAGRKQTLD
jgi:hypothetical protein